MPDLKQHIVSETIEYCNISSISGLVYFFNSRLNLLERFFWVIAFLTMVVFSGLSVNQAVVAWIAAPTILVTESVNNPVSTIQFPTVTICPDFTPDRFGFVKNVLNTFTYQCDQSYSPCTFASSAIRHWQQQWQYPEIAPYEYDVLLANYERFMLSIPNVTLDNVTLASDSLKPFILAANPNSVEYGMLRCKFKAKCNNYDIYDLLNLNSVQFVNGVSVVNNNNNDDNDSNSSNDNNNDNMQLLSPTQYSLLLRTYIMLAMPMPGKLGNLLYNLKSYQSYPNTWFSSPMPDDYFFMFYQEIFNNMLEEYQSLGITSSEISAILDPVPTYIASQKYPRQFPTTVKKQMEKGVNCFETENYFGTLLGPHLKQVMEVMFHCTLRVKPTFPERFARLSDIYGRMFNSTTFTLNVENEQTHLEYPYVPQPHQFPVDILREPFYPTWEEYKTSHFPIPYYWRPYSLSNQSLLMFENNPLPQYKADYTGNINIDADVITAKLKAKYQYQQMLSSCQGPGVNRMCDDDIFQPVLTDNGVCYSYNGNYFNLIYKNNTYTQMFKEIFSPMSNNSTNSTILTNENNGKAFQMFIVLDSFKSKVVDPLKGTFRVSISSILGFTSVRDTAIEVDPGYYTSMTITPVQYKTTKAFSELSLEERQCRYADEMVDEQSLFKFYSSETCDFECRLRYSRVQVNCTPWNYPQYEDDITVICDGEQSYLFESKMNEKANCTCLPDCEEVVFTVGVVQKNIDYQKECYAPKDQPYGMSLDDLDLGLLVGEKIRHMDGEEYMFWYNQVITSSPTVGNIFRNNGFYRYMDPRLTQDVCEQLLQKDIALLSIEVALPTFTTMQRDIANTFTTKISNIGGTLGLFTGMSILSFFEIGFLIYRIILGSVKKAPKIIPGNQ